MRVLLVDDDTLAGRFAAGVVRRAGMEVDWVTGGREAIEAGATGRYDLVLLDLGLPEVPGLVVARTIRACETESGARRVRIVALTAAAPALDELEKYGIDAFVPKPLSQTKVTAILGDIAGATEEPAARPVLM